MIVPANTSKERRIQEQVQTGTDPLDFYYKLNLINPGPYVNFGLKSSDNTERAVYKLRSGLVYDYSGRLVSTYQSGANVFEYGLKSGLTGFSSYQTINDRLISLDDFFTGYSAKPFDRFFVANSGANDLSFELNINGFIPDTKFSNLTSIGDNFYSGNFQQSNELATINYGLFDISIAEDRGSVYSFDQNGVGKINYVISGNNLLNGDIVDLGFNTYYGNVSKSLSVVSQGGGGGTDVNGISETGIYINLYGDTNEIAANSSSEFELHYYSNLITNVLISLSGVTGTSLSYMSGIGPGLLDFSGYIRKSGVLYSSEFATGIADLNDAINLGFNSQYVKNIQYLDIEKKVAVRETGSFFTGPQTFEVTGVLLKGTYKGPYTPFIDKIFSGYGNAYFNYEFTDSDQGIYEINQPLPGNLNPDILPFWIDGIPYSDLYYFPDSSALTSPPTTPNNIQKIFTGEGIITKQINVGDILGYGFGDTANSKKKVAGVGTGNITYMGDSYDYHQTLLNDKFVAQVKSTHQSANGILTNGSLNFYGTGFSIDGQYSQIDSYPTGPSKIIVDPCELIIVTDLNLPSVTMYSGSTGPQIPTLKEYTGFTTGYVQFQGGVFNGPVFKDPLDTGIYPYINSSEILSNGESYFGCGAIFMSGGSFDGVNQYGLYITSEYAGGDMEVSYSLRSGVYHGEYKTFTKTAYFTGQNVNQAIYPKVIGIPVDGNETFTHDSVYLEFQNRIFYPKTTGLFQGYGKIPATNITEKFNLEYSETPFDSTDPTPTIIDYKEENYFYGDQYVKTGENSILVPYEYPADYKKAYLRVSYITEDDESYDQAILKVAASGTTGTLTLFTNAS